MSTIQIVPIANTKSNIKKFVKSAWQYYKGNKYWVPPIISDQMTVIHKGAFHEFGIMQPFLAYRDGAIVGRITAHIDLRPEINKDKTGNFGFFECVNDQEVASALFSAAEKWLKEKGMTKMVGPYSFMVYELPGMLLDDYDNIPALELNYNPPYYPALCTGYGFEKVIDWYAYRMTHDQKLPALFYKAHDKVQKESDARKNGLLVRNSNLAKFDEEKIKILDIFNEAWKNNYGHVPFTDRQWEKMSNEVKLVVKEELCMFAEYNGETAGFILSIPDANMAIQKANGRLFPFGIFKILLGMRKITRLKTYIMGVLPKYRMRGLEAYFFVETLERGKKLGYVEADMSLIVENNLHMRNALDHMGAKIYKTYRIFGKTF